MKTRQRSIHVVNASVRAAVGALMIVSAAGCGGSSEASTESNDSALNGVWSTRSAGIALSLTLAWTPDSVTGTGTYLVLGNTLGCGGETLAGNGKVTFAAARSGTAVAGRMAFDNGWKPPYAGAVETDIRINGGFQSADRGTCPFPLYFGFVP